MKGWVIKLLTRKTKILSIGSATVFAALSLVLVSCSNQQEPTPAPKPNPIPPNISEFRKGGELIYNSTKNLNVDKYLSVIQKLNFKEYINISDLTNDILNERLTKDESFSGLKLSILNNSSQTAGELFLSLNGKYQDLEIKNEKITISNFPKYDFFNSNAFIIDVFKINQMSFINDLRDNTNITNISIEDFFKYNNDLNIRYTSVATEEKNIVILNELYRNNFISSMTFSNVNLINNEWIITFDIEEKKYENGMWIITHTQTVKLKKYKVNLDVQKAALEVLSQTVIIKRNDINDIYSSTVFANWRWGKANLSDYVILDKKIADFYFETIDNIEIKAQELNVNDDLGTLEGNFIISPSHSVNKFAKFKGLITNFKTANTLFTNANLDIDKNKLIIKPNSRFEGDITKDVVKNETKIKTLKINQSVSFVNNEFSNSWGRTFPTKEDALFNNYLNEIHYDQTFEDSLRKLSDFDSQGLNFNILGEKSLYSILAYQRLGAFKNMFIKLIYISEIQDAEQIVVTRVDETSYKITYKLNIELDYLNSTQTISLTNETIVTNPFIV